MGRGGQSIGTGNSAKSARFSRITLQRGKDAKVIRRSADIPVRSNVEGSYGLRSSQRGSAFEACCGQECPRSGGMHGFNLTFFPSFRYASLVIKRPSWLNR